MTYPGKFNPSHYALQNNKYDFLKNTVINCFLSSKPDVTGTPEQKEQKEQKEQIEKILESIVGPVKDKYDRTFTFRLDRVNYFSELQKKLAESTTWSESLSLRSRLAKYNAGSLTIYCIDKYFEKSTHNAKIQANKISTLGYPVMLAIRSAGVIANGRL